MACRLVMRLSCHHLKEGYPLTRRCNASIQSHSYILNYGFIFFLRNAIRYLILSLKGADSACTLQCGSLHLSSFISEFNYNLMSPARNYSGQMPLKDRCACDTVSPSINFLKCQSFIFLKKVECQFLFYLEQLNQPKKGKSFDSWICQWKIGWWFEEIGINVQICTKESSAMSLGRGKRWDGVGRSVWVRNTALELPNCWFWLVFANSCKVFL